MKPKLRSRALAALLSLMLIVIFLPTMAFAASPTTLYVNGTNILTTSDNTVACGNGTAEYDPNSNTLTLTDAVIEGEFNGSAAINTDGDLTIRLIGNSTIISGWYGIFSSNINNDSTITVDGSGTLTIQSDGDCIRSEDVIIGIAGEADAPTLNLTSKGNYSSGIYAENTLTIQNSAKIDAESENGYALCGENGLSITDSEVRTVTTDPYTNTILTRGNLTITNSKMIASSNGYPAIYVESNIVISNSTLEASAADDAAIYSSGGTIRITDSTVKAQSPFEYYTINGVGGCFLNGTWLDNVDSVANLSGTGTVENCVIIDENIGTVVGNPIITRDAELRNGVELTIPEQASLTIVDGVTLTNNGTVNLEGNFINNNGIVLCAESSHTGGTATCTAKAVCALCKNEYGNLLPHELTKNEAKPATHMTEGNIEYWYCDGCDKYFSDEAGTKEIALEDTVIPKLTEHTADETGWHSDETSHWNTCECGEKLNEAAHTFAWVTDKEATATKAGSRHEECKICGYAKAAVEIPATGTTEDPSEPPADTDKPSGDQTGNTSSPETGDDSNIALWIAVMFAAGTALTGTAVYSRKRKYSR